MAQKKSLGDQELRAAATAYVLRRFTTCGGVREAWRGFVHKTCPLMLGLSSSLRASHIAALFIRVALVACAPLVAILSRKLIVAPAATQRGGVDSLLGLLTDLHAPDYALGFAALLITVLPKLLDKLGKRDQRAGGQQHYYELSAALDRLPHPPAGAGPDVDAAMLLALSALRSELAELIGETKGKRLTDITLLEFGDGGSTMQVRVRTAVHEPIKRPKPAWMFLAYYVGLRGRWFAEHDFLHTDNPFPPVRLTVVGDRDVDYRSVLFLPIVSSSRPAGLSGGGSVVDRCVGMICVHSAKPYRFWRWGDHWKKMGGFGDVAYERALPYIALISKLLDPNAHSMEVRPS